MKCDKCHSEIESGSLYCPICGEPVQLVPNYNELEEELLSKIVEDKNLSGKDKFATGVYVSLKNEIEEALEKNEEASNLPFFKRPYFKLILIFVITSIFIILIGFFSINHYMSTHNYDYYISSAQTQESEGQYTNALESYSNALSVEPSSHEALLGIGRMYYEIGDYSNCVAYMLMALEEDKENSTVYSYLLKSYYALGDIESIKDLAEDAPNEEIRLMISSYIVFPPEFSQTSGSYDEILNIYLTSSDDYKIYYTINGKDPTKSGILYKSSIELTEGETTIKAVCMSDDGQYSDIVEETYTITYYNKAPATVTVSVNPGYYNTATTITIDVPAGCGCFYTWDGTIPNEYSNEYEDGILIPQGTNTLSVIIIDSHGGESAVYTGEYTCYY